MYFEYPDIRALAADSETIAEVVVTRELFRGEVREVPSVITEARVVDGLKNATSGELLRIKQWAQLKAVEVDGGVQEPLRPGQRYLLFLSEMFPGHTAGGDEQLVGLLGPVQGVAAFRQTGDTSFELVPGVPRLAGRIPQTVTKDEARSALRSQ